jgi:hypothetical protein
MAMDHQWEHCWVKSRYVPAVQIFDQRFLYALWCLRHSFMIAITQKGRKILIVALAVTKSRAAKSENPLEVWEGCEINLASQEMEDPFSIAVLAGVRSTNPSKESSSVAVEVQENGCELGHSILQIVFSWFQF